jgi:hypothetical protein
MPRLAALRLADCNGLRVKVDVLAAHPTQFAIAAAGEEGSAHHLPEVLGAAIDQTSALI